MTIGLDNFGVASLRQGFSGQLLLPDDQDYDACRRVWNAMVDKRPAIIARCADTAAVAAAIRFGRARGLELAVRCGGHSITGLSVPQDGVMVDLSLMGAVRIDPQGRRAWVQGGALLGNLDKETQRFGMATTAGNVSHTGVGGLTLAGGMGWLARRFGLACDNVTAFEMVTADGQTMRVTENENSELFWGLRGGGGNFGVITEFEFRLHRVGTEAVEVDMFYRPDDGAAALQKWRDLIADAPLASTFTASVATAGDWSFLPPDMRRRTVVSVGYVWVGDPQQRQDLLREVRSCVAPAAERVSELSYLGLQSQDDNVQGHHLRRYWKGHYLRHLNDDAIRAFISRGVVEGDKQPDPTRLPSGAIQCYGGAITSVGPDDTAISYRDAQMEFVVRTSWSDRVEDKDRISAARRFANAIEPFSSGLYVNGAQEGTGSRHAYDGRKLARLAALKDEVDPANVFHPNASIRPSMRHSRGDH